MSALELGLASVAVVVGAAIQGSIGFGVNLIVAPALIAIDPALVPGPPAFLSLVLTLLMVRRERSSADVRGVGWALAGRIPGTLAGAAAVAVLSERGLSTAFGILLLLAVLMTASGYRLRPTPGALVAAGLLSGFMGTTTSVGGPPMALVYQEADGATIRSTLAAFLTVGISLSLLSLAAVGRFGGPEIRASLLLVPPTIAGFLASRRIAPWLDRGHIRTAVLVISGASAVVILARALT
jgi:uncharacterized membrane protein YfcA